MSRNDKIEVVLATKERGYVKVYKDFLNAETLSVEEKMVYIALKSFVRYGEDQGEVYPSMETLCRLTSLSKPRATRNINSLVKKGIVIKERRGLTKTNLYTLKDNPAMWQTNDLQELKELSNNIIPYSNQELIEELQRRGVLVKVKEPVSSTDQSKDTELSQNQYKTDNYHITGSPKSQAAELYTFDDIKELIGYDALLDLMPGSEKDIDSFFNLIYDTVNTAKPYIKISGTDKPVEVVRGRLLKLNYEHIGYAITKYNEQTGRIKNPTAYKLKLLYDAYDQMHSDITNQVQHDFNGTKEDPE